MIKRLARMGITSDMAYLAAAASIILSIMSWYIRRESQDVAKGERFGIFVGLWAPTLAILGRALEEQEHRLKITA